MILSDTKGQIADAVTALMQTADSVRLGWRDTVQVRFYEEYIERTANEWHCIREELEALEAKMVDVPGSGASLS